MEITELLKGVDCTCGKHHSCDIDFIAIERGAISHLTRLCAQDACILIVADENTFAVAGAPTLEALTCANVKKVIFPGDEIREHKADEYISIDNLVKNAQIIAAAMYELAK